MFRKKERKKIYSSKVVSLTIGDAVIKAGNKEFENVQKGVCKELGNFRKGVGSVEREGFTNHDCNQVLFKAFTMTNFQNFLLLWWILNKFNHKLV